MAPEMKTVLITGANRGIGLEHAKVFAARGVRIFATARSPEQATELHALAAAHAGRITLLPYDAADSEAPARLKNALANTPIDLLLANAGAMADREAPFGSVDVEAILQLFRVNALAPLKLAEALADNVASSQRKLIAFQSSLMGSVGDNGSGGYYAYRVSKAALNMIAKSVSNDLRSRGVTAVALHPGWVKTRMGGASAPVTVEQCVAGQQRLLDRLSLADSGQFFNYDGSKLPW
jgi:NAD(P)-dependent dehydrogenase (short-subunit alcohol dehydrogenase family)